MRQVSNAAKDFRTDSGSGHVGQGAAIDVALVAMPFAPIQTPSLALGLLKAGLARQGIRTKTFNFAFEFASTIGVLFYDQISDGEPARSDLVGDWIFNGAVFDESSIDIDGYVCDVLKSGSLAHRSKAFRTDDQEIDAWVEAVLRARAQVPGFIESCVETLTEHRPRLVGITSMFQEHVAALALAKCMKEVSPDTYVVLGGSNCEGPMGLETARQFAFVDAVVSGEGDDTFPPFVQAVLMGEQPAPQQGVYLAGMVSPETPPQMTPPITDMDSLPYPDFDDHFEQLAASGLSFDDIAPPHLVFETARGCWWGERHHCTFCGLNGATMAFRSKSATRAMDELTDLVERYPDCPIGVSDNILDYRYLKDFVPELIRRNPGANLFYEVKANLKKSELVMLRDAGIARIQPGVESFSTPILKLMRKGVRGIHNVQMLKWCRELGVTPIWGLLWGFPGEDPAEYRMMADLLPLLSHLAPPIGATQIRLDRFSPNHANAATMGFANVKPFPSYGYVYPIAEEALENLAYFFTYDYGDGRDVAAYTQDIEEAVRSWRDDAPRSALFFLDKQDALLLWDLRPAARRQLYVLSGPLREIYLTCDSATSIGQIRRACQGCTELEILAALEVFLDHGLMMREGDLYLSLAIVGDGHELSSTDCVPFLSALQRLCRPESSEFVIPLQGMAGMEDHIKVAQL